MPALDIAAQQQPIDIAGSFMRGKAMRIAEENEARKMQMLEKQFETQQKLDESKIAEVARAERDAFIMDDENIGILDAIIEGKESGAAWNEANTRKYPSMRAKLDQDGDGVIDEITPEEAKEAKAIILDARSKMPKPKPTVSKPGDIFRDPVTNEIVDRNPVTPKKSGTVSRDQKIESLVAQGVSQSRAANLVDGRERIEVTETGAVRHINDVTGTVTEIPIGGEDVIIPEPEVGKTLWDYAEAGTGISSAVSAGLAVPKSMMGLDYNQAAVKARQALKTETGALIRALSINPRFPVAEMERVRDEVSLDPAMLDTADLMRDRMRVIDENLSKRVEQYKRDADDPKLPSDLREARLQAASDIENFLAVLGVPEGDAPQAAIKHLMKNPDLKDAFMDKYGYLPKGVE